MPSLADTPHTLSLSDLTWSPIDVLENLDVGVAIVNREQHTLMYHNRALRDILTPPGEPPSYPQLYDLFLSQDDPASGRVEEREPARLGNRLLRFSLGPLPRGLTILLVRDDTERARLESIAQAVNTMDNIGFIFSGIRHEVGNPLNTIKMTTSVLQRNLDSFSRETVQCYLERTANEVSRMEYLLRSLKNFSMYERVEIAEHDLSDFLRHFRTLVEKDLESRGITLQMQCERGIRALFDPRALHQALVNLVSNASDAVARRHRPLIRLSATTLDRLVWLGVEDNGHGISDAQQQQLFQPFFTSKDHGNGLGLVITRKLLAKMNASLQIRSQEGAGTIVRIALPLADSPSPSPDRDERS